MILVSGACIVKFLITEKLFNIKPCTVVFIWLIIVLVRLEPLTVIPRGIVMATLIIYVPPAINTSFILSLFSANVRAAIISEPSLLIPSPLAPNCNTLIISLLACNTATVPLASVWSPYPSAAWAATIRYLAWPASPFT